MADVMDAPEAEAGNGMPEGYEPRFAKLYRDVVVPGMLEKFKYTNPMMVPSLDKVVINMGVGEAVADTRKVQSAIKDLALIAGQQPVMTRAKNSIAGFKVRENMPLGAKVTLRRQKMFEFLDRFVTIALPRVKDFRGLNPKSFDGRGNFATGIKEHLVFPEIIYDRVDQVWGMDIIVATNAKTDEEAREMLKLFNFPFRDSAAKN